MKAITLIGLGLLTVSLSACGVRDESENEVSSGDSSGGTSLPVIGNTTNPTAGSAIGEEGTGNEVQLRFTDEYTGYWENDTRADSLSTEIVRLTFGERYYHIETFVDQSTGLSTSGENCYRRNGLSLTNLNGRGLRGAADEDKTESYSEWTLEGDNLQSSVYDEIGELVANSTGTATHSRALTGLAANDLQICTN